MFMDIVNHLWQSTLFAVAVAALTPALRNNGAHVRYWLWWAASAKFLVPFALLAALGKALPGNTRPILLAEWPAALATIAEPLAVPPSSSALVLALACIWATGALVVLGRSLAAALRLGAVVRAAAPWPHSLQNTPRAFAVLGTEFLLEPALVGIVKPVLLLPRGIDKRLTREQLDAVIAHELSHWRRRDNLTATIHLLVETAFWFHPLVWWIGARLIDERERACDEAVLGAGHDACVYAEGILEVCEHYVASSLRCTSGVSGADLKQRVLDIARNRNLSALSLSKQFLLAASAFGTVATPMVIGLVTAEATYGRTPPVHRDVPLVRTRPEYPPEALAAGLEGFVTVAFTITIDGRVEDPVVIDSTSPVFEPSAIRAIRRWRYPPSTRDGVSTETRTMQAVIPYTLQP